jgi:hypothetical protein
MGKEQAEKIARLYIQSHRESFGKVSKMEVDTAVRRVAGALRGIRPTKNGRASATR